MASARCSALLTPHSKKSSDLCCGFLLTRWSEIRCGHDLKRIAALHPRPA